MKNPNNTPKPNGTMKLREFYYKTKKEIAFSAKLRIEQQLRAEFRERMREEMHAELEAKQRCNEILRNRMTILNWRHDIIERALVCFGRRKDPQLCATVDSFIAKAYSNDALFEFIENWLIDRDTDGLLRKVQELGL